MKVKLMIGIGCLMACMVCSTAFAQDNYAKYDIFFGYSLLKIDEKTGITHPENIRVYDINNSNLLKKGISASLTYNCTPALGLEAFFQRNSGDIINYAATLPNHIDEALGSSAIHKESRTDMALFVGPRFIFRNLSESVTPFIHGLAGISHYGGSQQTIHAMPEISSYNDFKSHTFFGFALGSGLDIPVNAHFTIRAVQADYYMAIHDKYLRVGGGYAEKKLFNNFNLSFGVVFHLGK